MELDEILITGYSKIQTGTTSYEQFGGKLVISLLLERKTGIIREVDCSLTTNLAKKYLNTLLCGKSLEDLEQIELLLEKNYFGVARKPIFFALTACREKYKMLVSP